MSSNAARLERLLRGLLGHALGYFASTQELFLVGCHFGWFMLAIIGLMDGSQQDAMRQVGGFLLWGYKVLGGVDETGRGGVPEMMNVWGKVSLVFYGLEVVLGWVAGPRRPWRIWHEWAVSTAVAAGGYGVAYALAAPSWSSTRGEGVSHLLGMVLISSVLSAWALGSAAFLHHFQRLVRGDSMEAGPRGEPSREPRVLPILMTGAAVMALGFGVAMVRPKNTRPEPSNRTAPPAMSLQGGPVTEDEDPRCRGASECERRCEQGSPAACGMLAELLESGLMGAPKDEARARELTEHACGMGDGMSCMRAAAALEVVGPGEPEPTREELRQAEALHRRACTLGNADGCAGVAYLYQGVRNGPPKDPSVVRDYFARACELGKQDVCDRARAP